jgi:hypothetical protein
MSWRHSGSVRYSGSPRITGLGGRIRLHDTGLFTDDLGGALMVIIMLIAAWIALAWWQ